MPQPFYHRAVVIFTTTTGASRAEVENFLNKIKQTKESREIGLVPHSFYFEEYDEPEAGDPHDLT